MTDFSIASEYERWCRDNRSLFENIDRDVVRSFDLKIKKYHIYQALIDGERLKALSSLAPGLPLSFIVKVVVASMLPVSITQRRLFRV